MVHHLDLATVSHFVKFALCVFIGDLYIDSAYFNLFMSHLLD